MKHSFPLTFLFVWTLGSAATVAHAQAPLEVPGHAPASHVPATGTGPRPLVIALHGNFDRPEWMCASWAPVVAGRAFLLCPRGTPRTDGGDDRWTLPPVGALERELSAARAALERRYPGRIDPGPVVWVGFSLGAHRVAEMALAAPSPTDPSRLARVQLVEGGRAMWQPRNTRAFVRRGGRVAWVCGLPWCEARARAALRGVSDDSGRVERIPAEHSDRDRMTPAIRETFEWLVADDARY